MSPVIMFPKIALVILVLGGLAAALLVDRQQRLDLAAEMSRTHSRLRQHEQALWRLRTDVANRTRPAEIRAAIERLGVKFVPIPDRLDRSGAGREELLANGVPPPPIPTSDRLRLGGD